MRQDLDSTNRFYIPDPWDETPEAFVETTTPAVVSSTAQSPDLVDASSHQLAAAPTPDTATLLLQDELKLRGMEPSFLMKFQEILAHLYWADSICDA